MKVTLRLRNLSNGDGSLQEFGSVDEAMPWLRARPAMIEVLGVVFEGITKEENDLMRGAMRPLDDAEKAAVQKLDAAEHAAREAKNEERMKEAQAAAERDRAAAKTADPNRPMELRYRFDSDALVNTDSNDDRVIPIEAAKAVMEWVNERQEWVAPRGQAIGEAKVTVYPNTIPKGRERVVHGSFVPIAAAEAKKS